MLITFSFWGLQDLQTNMKSSSVAFLLSTFAQGQWYHFSQASQNTQTTVPLGLTQPFSPLAHNCVLDDLPLALPPRAMILRNSGSLVRPPKDPKLSHGIEHYAFSIVYYFDSSSSLGS
jgi:hypothetical protein